MSGSSTILVGDCRERLREIEAGTVQCCVTSPPYWGLRDYGCAGQVGLEPKAWQYTETLVQVFRLVRETLTETGTVWLNLGDCHAGKQLQLIPARVALALQAAGWWLRSDIVWAKSISGAYRGGSCMPESVTDRPTRSHEYVFLLAKSERYYFDQEAVREANETPCGTKELRKHWDERPNNGAEAAHCGGYRMGSVSSGRNIRSVWHHSPEPFPGSHFATMPPALALPCIRAGTSQRGCCPECRAPWERMVERERQLEQGRQGLGLGATHDHDHRNTISGGPPEASSLHHDISRTTIGWQPSCDCAVCCLTCGGSGVWPNRSDQASECPTCLGARRVPPAPIPCLVLDPFAGAGTTGLVATQNGRDFIGCELNPDYAEMARKRIANPASVGRPKEDPKDQLGLFGCTQ